jgi:hypothetical protein
MAIGSSSNTTSVLESSTRLVFPVEDSVRSKIPLWLKFYCYEYSNTAAGRAIAYSRSAGGSNILGMTNEKAQILVPAPVNFETSTAHNYVSEATSAVNLFSPFVGNLIDAAGNALFPELAEDLGKMKRGVQETFDIIDTAIGNISGNLSSIGPPDISDTMYQATGASRTFEIRLVLQCLSERDSKTAGNIVRAFEALSLPTARSSTLSLASTKSYHPPLWVFGIGPADSLKFDPDWTGHPQICVLRTVKNRKAPIETNAIAAIGYGGLLKPVAYSITLVFQELEPAFRVTNPGLGGVGTQITNRSGVMVGGGTTITATITNNG